MANFWFSLAGWSLLLPGVTVAAAFLSLPVVCIKFIVANLAADIAVNDLISNDLISVSALPCVSGEDCGVVAASAELLAVTSLLALFCWTFSVTSLLALLCWTFCVSLVVFWLLVCSVVFNTKVCDGLLFCKLGKPFPTPSTGVAAFTEWSVKLIPKMVTPNNTEATPTLSLRKL